MSDSLYYTPNRLNSKTCFCALFFYILLWSYSHSSYIIAFGDISFDHRRQIPIFLSTEKYDLLICINVMLEGIGMIAKIRDKLSNLLKKQIIIDTPLVILTNVWIACFSLYSYITENHEIEPYIFAILAGLFLLLLWLLFSENQKTLLKKENLNKKFFFSLLRPGYQDCSKISKFLTYASCILFVVLVLLPLFIEKFNIPITYIIATAFFFIGVHNYKNKLFNLIFKIIWQNFACPLLAYLTCIIAILNCPSLVEKVAKETFESFLYSFGSLLVNTLYVVTVPMCIFLISVVVNAEVSRHSTPKEKKEKAKLKKYKGGQISLGSLLRQKEVQYLLGFLSKLLYCLVLSGILLAIPILAIIVFSHYTINDIVHIITLLCGVFSPEKINEHVSGDIAIAIVGKVIIALLILPLSVAIFMRPTNPIFFSEAVIVRSKGNNSKKNNDKEKKDRKYELVFRYWIIKRRSDFLHDVHLTAYLQENRHVNKEESIPPLYLWNEHLTMARGIRQWSCDIGKINERAQNILKTHPEYSNIGTIDSQCNFLNLLLTHKKDSDYSIVFHIRATDDFGHTYSKIKRYELSNVIYCADFAMIHENDWNPRVTKKEKIVKYQNFNKLIEHKDKFIYIDSSKKPCDNSYQQSKNKGFKIIDKEEEQSPDNYLIKIINNLCRFYVDRRSLYKNVVERIDTRKKRRA